MKRADNILFRPWKELRSLQNRTLHHFITKHLYPFSPYYRKLFDKNKIKPHSIKTVNDELTAFANIMTDQSDNQLTAFYPGAMSIDYSLEVDTDNVALAIIAPGNANDMLKLANLYFLSFIIDFSCDTLKGHIANWGKTLSLIDC